MFEGTHGAAAVCSEPWLLSAVLKLRSRDRAQSDYLSGDVQMLSLSTAFEVATSNMLCKLTTEKVPRSEFGI